MTVNGTITHLVAGHYEATVGSVGASLLRLTYRGRHLVQPADPGRLADGYQGRTLVPWPNRVVGARYTVGRNTHHLPVNEHETGAALHGLAAFQTWSLKEVGQDHGTWELDLPASYGYPFDVRCEVRCTLDVENGLTMTVSGTNQGDQPAPFGASTHAYLSCDDRPLSECTLQLPAASALMTDDALSPTDLVPVAGTELDFVRPAAVGERRIDNAYTDLPPQGWSVELTHPDAPGVRMRATAPWVQLYTGDRIGRRGAAVEPMTCPPDAFNSDPEGVLLLPGSTRRLSLSIGAIS